MPIRPKTFTMLCAAAFVPGLALYAQQPAPAAKEDARAKIEQKEAPKKEATKTDVEKIIDEGTNRSQVMKTLSYLSDVIGPRLTGSPGLKLANEWTRDQLKGYGLENAHLEPWGPFGNGWTLKGFSAEVVEPLCIPLIAYPKAWSPGTHGRVVAEVVYLDANTDSDYARYKGQLRGKIVMTSPALPVAAHFEPLGVRQTDAQLLDLANSPMPGEGPRRPRRQQAPAAAPGPGQAVASNNPAAAANNPMNIVTQMIQNRRKLAFAVEEGAIAVLDPSRMGDGGTIFVAQASVPNPPAAGGGQANTPVASNGAASNGQPNAGQGGNGGGGGDGQGGGGGQGGAGRGAGPRGPSAWDKDAPKNLPQVAVSKEHYNRMIRMIEAGQTLKVAIDLAVEFQDMDLMAYNTIAEIRGTDLKDEIVMLGGHLDSWHAGTGATDNAAGCAVGMEAVRIIKALGLKPRRTIRIGLWSGEEQGLHGSKAYVKEHFGEAPAGGGGGGMFGGGLVVGSPKEGTKKPEYDKFSAYFNLDNGTGKVRGVYLQGNEAVRPIFRQWLVPFRDMGASTLSPSNTGGTDHLSFDAIGLPGFQFIQDEVEYDTRTHHSNQDVFDRIQADDLKQAATI
ncbi:MAG TPA: M20/M25/M40 family metallo-hydrolase, partial [Isosphaeraceae bacterium]